tara:strand:- start:629 stop:970 length:342 start_codon:yes stop_codon:yes gene_type:complete
MKKLLMLLLLLPLAGSARMFPQEVPMSSVCWDSWEEAIKYHKDILEEYPVGRGLINNPNGPTFVAIVVNLKKPSWTYIHFHHNVETGEQVVCALSSGSEWEIITLETKEKIEI